MQEQQYAIMGALNRLLDNSNCQADKENKL